MNSVTIKPKLFLLHFAGGNCYSYQNLNSVLISHFETEMIELPGRGKRLNEKHITDIKMAVDDLYRQVLDKKGDSPILIYGHSMGARLAFLLTHLLEKSKINPLCLIVSGNIGPNMETDKEKIRHLCTRDFFEKIANLGGIPVEILQNTELLAFIEPILRADFELLESEFFSFKSKINTPIIAFMGEKEKNCNEIDNWKKYTTSFFQGQIIPGGHFFIQENPYLFAQKIIDNYVENRFL